MNARQLNALDYAKNEICKSDLFPFIKNIILFGSCARGEEHFESDVDLLLVLDEDIKKIPEYSSMIHLLKGSVSSSEFDAVETDLKVMIGEDWRTDPSTFCQFVRKEGIEIWP
ncbi:MAG: nucleotidyltransferase family protein [Lachnospiraceae bacterium]